MARSKADRAAEALETLAGELTPEMKARLDGAIGRCAQAWHMKSGALYDTIIRFLDLAADARKMTEYVTSQVTDSAQLRKGAEMLLSAADRMDKDKSP